MAQTKQLIGIGEAARTAGVASSTLRYYEQEGLLTPTDRNGAGYRFYDVGAVERLQFIRAAQAVGFTLGDIRALLDLDEEECDSCQVEVQRLLERRLAEVNQKMKDLRSVQAALGRALDRCRRSNGECAVLKRISSRKRTRRE